MFFSLKQYDFELLTFELQQEGLDGFACSILSVNEAKRHLLPLGMPVNGDGLLSQLKSRIISRNREHMERILSICGLSQGHLEKLVFGGFLHLAKVQLARFSVVTFRQPCSNLPASAFLPIR